MDGRKAKEIGNYNALMLCNQRYRDFMEAKMEETRGKGQSNLYFFMQLQNSSSFRDHLTEQLRGLRWKKLLKNIGECHENSLIESFEMIPHLICLS